MPEAVVIIILNTTIVIKSSVVTFSTSRPIDDA